MMIGTSTGRGARVAGRVQHPHPRALPLDRLAAQQAAVGADVGVHERPRDRAVAHRPPAGEPRPERDGDAAGGQRGERGGGRGVDHRMAQGGHEDARPEADALRPLGRQRERHPDVGALLRRVVQPGALIAQLLGERDVLGRVESGRKRA